MINLKIIGAAALLAIAPALVSATADARPGGGHGGGGGFSRGGGGGGGAFRGGGGGGMRSFGGGGAFRGGNFAARPGFSGGPRVGNFGRSAAIGAGPGALAGRQAFAGRPVAQLGSGGRHWGGRGWRGRHWRGYGYGFGGGLALGALGSSYYYSDPYYYDDSYAYAPDYDYAAAPVSGDDAAYCAQRFKSYDPASGTYLGYDGQRHPCP